MFSMKVTGDKEVAKSLNKGVGISDALKKLTLNVEALAKKSTVVDTGRLRSSIASRISKDSSWIGTNIEYAEFVELGTPTGTMEARHMEGGVKVLGQGMFGYTEEKMGGEIKEFEQQILKDVKREITG